MKLPKKIIIAGKEWKVKKLPNQGGGSFESCPPEICVGTKWRSEIAISFIHEALEAILTERMHRYKLPYVAEDNSNYMFVMNHEQMAQVSRDLALALKDVLK